MAVRVSSPVLVGRTDELASLEASLAAAAAGRPSLVVVSGEAGVGKTRLVTHFAQVAREGRSPVLIGGCLNVGQGGLPYAPLVEGIRNLVRELDEHELHRVVGNARQELARLVPDLDPDATSDAPGLPLEGAAQSRLFELLLGMLGRLGGDQPGLLVLEDIHWLDAATRDLITYLARNLSTERVLVVLTYRTDELLPGGGLVGYLAELERNPRVSRLTLAPLSSEETAGQLEGILGRAPAAELTMTVHGRSEGNPFYTEELLAGSLRQAAALPASLRELLLARVGQVSDAARAVLRLCAVAGRPLDDRLLAEASGLPETDVAKAVREALAHQLLAVDEADSRYRLRHALLQEVVYGELLPAERRELHLRFATALAGAGPGETATAAAGELAHHWSAAERRVEALGCSVAAAREAERVYAFAQAHRHYERALELWARVPASQRPVGVDRIQLLSSGAEVANLGDDLPRALALLRMALTEVQPDAAPAVAGVLHSGLGYLLWQQGEIGAAMDEHHEAVRLVPREPPTAARARVLVGMGGALMSAGRYRESALVADEALACARAGGAQRHEARALNMLGADLVALGEVDRGLEALRAALALARQIGDADTTVVAYHNLAHNLREADRIQEALQTELEGIEAARELGLDRRYGATLRAAAADALFRLGRWSEADDVAREALAINADGPRASYPRSVLGRLLLARGEQAAAEELLRSAERAAVDPDMRAHVLAGIAELAVWQGEADKAYKAVQTGLRDVSRGDDELLAAPLLAVGLRAEADRMELGRAPGERAVAEGATAAGASLLELVNRLGHSGSLASRPSARAELDQAGAEWNRLQGRRESEAWAHLAARWHELSAPYRVAYALYRQAEALLSQRHRRKEAARALEDAQRITSSLGAATLGRAVVGLARRARVDLSSGQVATLAEPHATASPTSASPGKDHAASGAALFDRLGLSPRELEVLALVAAGRTNGQIAETLFISPKTAGVHVTHILRKLGVGNRVEAATIAARRGLIAEDGTG